MSDESNSVSADREFWVDHGSNDADSALGAEPATSTEGLASAGVAAAVPTGVDAHADLKRGPEKEASVHDVRPLHLATSTFFSLVMVLAILLLARWMVPPLVESVRYGWYRGQLRARCVRGGQ